jgi:hypothetical protein
MKIPFLNAIAIGALLKLNVEADAVLFGNALADVVDAGGNRVMIMTFGFNA